MAYILCPCGHKTIKPTQRTTCPACGTSFSIQTPQSGPSNAPIPINQPMPPAPNGQTAVPIPINQWTSPIPFNQPIPINQPISANSGTSYPQDLPHRPPDLVGTLLTFDRDTIDVPTDWSLTVLRIVFFPFLFSALTRNFFGTNPQPKQTMTAHRIQIEDSSGNTHSAILKGDLQGDKPRLGQQVAFWGRSDKGTLAISHGYNQDTQAQISATYLGMGLLWVSRVAVIAVPVVILLLFLLNPSLLPMSINAIGAIIGLIIGAIIAGIILNIVIRAFVPWLPKQLVSIIVYALLFLALLTMCSSMFARLH